MIIVMKTDRGPDRGILLIVVEALQNGTGIEIGIGGGMMRDQAAIVIGVETIVAMIGTEIGGKIEADDMTTNIPMIIRVHGILLTVVLAVAKSIYGHVILYLQRG